MVSIRSICNQISCTFTSGATIHTPHPVAQKPLSSSLSQSEPRSPTYLQKIKDLFLRMILILNRYTVSFCSKIYRWVSFPFVSVWSLLKRIFIKAPAPVLESQDSTEPSLPQISKAYIEKFPSKDLFKLMVFGSKFKQNSPFVHPQGLKSCLQITQTFREGGFMHWWKQEDSLLSYEKALKAESLHPLETLYFFFINVSSTEGLLNLKTVSEESGLRFYLKCAGYTQTPWELFVSKQGRRLSAVGNDSLLSLLPGFCTALGLSLEEAREKIDAKNWDDFIVWILENRRDS